MTCPIRTDFFSGKYRISGKVYYIPGSRSTKGLECDE